VQEDSARPDVIVEFLFDQGLLFICVRNIGAKPALSIAVKFDKKILGLGGTKDISSLALFRKIEFLGPQRQIMVFLDHSGSYFRHKQPTRVQASISYKDGQETKYGAVITHDLEIYRDIPYLKTPSESSGFSGSGG
jgi:hypothetical protein